MKLLLRLESLILLAIAVMLYFSFEYSWLLFALLFLVPDISILAYLAGPRVGAVCYNLLHSYIGPGIIALFQVFAWGDIDIALIWVAHIAFDRALGFGLKYPDRFGHTHLGEIGRSQQGDIVV